MIVALVCAAIAWAFWHYLGQSAFEVFGLLFVVYLLAENYTLKQKLRERQDSR